MHYEKSDKVYEIILNICKYPKSNAEIALHLGFSPQRTNYYIKQQIANGQLIKLQKDGRIGVDTITYLTADKSRPFIAEPKREKQEKEQLTYSIKQLEVMTKREYAENSAMSKVENLAEKLAKRSQNLRNERKSSRVYVGISQVYNG